MECVSPILLFVFQAAGSLCYKIIIIILKSKAVRFFADNQALFLVGLRLVLDVMSILEAL